ncbi:MAG: hypothetical protein ACR2GW_12815, partial [Pyrinomonadaceae bacterium]
MTGITKPVPYATCLMSALLLLMNLVSNAREGKSYGMKAMLVMKAAIVLLALCAPETPAQESHVRERAR